MAPPRRLADVICAACGIVFRPHGAGRKFCSNRCVGVANQRDITESFWAKVSRHDAAACWLWVGGIGSHGYGTIQDHVAHRVSWEIHNGPIPAGRSVLHRCDVRKCVNPDHLFLGTQDDNMKDMALKGRQGIRKLSEAKVRAIRKLAASMKQRDIAKHFGVSQIAISHVVRRRNWKHVA